MGSIHVAIWRNEKQAPPFYNATFELRYKDREGDWKTSTSYGQMDLLALKKAADLAFDEIAALRKEDKEGHPVG